MFSKDKKFRFAAGISGIVGAALGLWAEINLFNSQVSLSPFYKGLFIIRILLYAATFALSLLLSVWLCKKDKVFEIILLALQAGILLDNLGTPYGTLRTLQFAVCGVSMVLSFMSVLLSDDYVINGAQRKREIQVTNGIINIIQTAPLLVAAILMLKTSFLSSLFLAAIGAAFLTVAIKLIAPPSAKLKGVSEKRGLDITILAINILLLLETIFSAFYEETQTDYAEAEINSLFSMICMMLIGASAIMCLISLNLSYNSKHTVATTWKFSVPSAKLRKAASVLCILRAAFSILGNFGALFNDRRIPFNTPDTGNFLWSFALSGVLLICGAIAAAACFENKKSVFNGIAGDIAFIAVHFAIILISAFFYPQLKETTLLSFYLNPLMCGAIISLHAVSIRKNKKASENNALGASEADFSEIPANLSIGTSDTPCAD